MSALGTRLASPVPRRWRRAQAGHWSFLFGEIAIYSFVAALASGVFLAVFFKPSMTGVVYHASWPCTTSWTARATRRPAPRWAQPGSRSDWAAGAVAAGWSELKTDSAPACRNLSAEMQSKCS